MNCTSSPTFVFGMLAGIGLVIELFLAYGAWRWATYKWRK